MTSRLYSLSVATRLGSSRRYPMTCIYKAQAWETTTLRYFVSAVPKLRRQGLQLSQIWMPQAWNFVCRSFQAGETECSYGCTPDRILCHDFFENICSVRDARYCNNGWHERAEFDTKLQYETKVRATTVLNDANAKTERKTTQRSMFQCPVLAQGWKTCSFTCTHTRPMCHMYSLGMCDYSWQDWCSAGWHVTKSDWRKICANLSMQNKVKHRGDDDTHSNENAEGAQEITPESKRRRLLDGIVDYDEL